MVITLLNENDTIVLTPSPSPLEQYGPWDSYDYFMLDGMGPHIIMRGRHLWIYRDEEGIFNSFKWD